MSKSDSSKLIKISETTYEKICRLGKFHDTYDSILSRILEQNEVKKSLTLQNFAFSPILDMYFSHSNSRVFGLLGSLKMDTYLGYTLLKTKTCFVSHQNKCTIGSTASCL